MPKSRIWTDIQLRRAVLRHKSYAAVLRELRLAPRGGNYATLKSHIKRLKLDISQFTHQGWLHGRSVTTNPGRPLAEILIRDSLYTNSSRLHKRLISAGLLAAKCNCCGRKMWQEQPIPLELSHQDGDNTNNLLENLELLCPNCHALTPTWRGRNIKARRSRC